MSTTIFVIFGVTVATLGLVVTEWGLIGLDVVELTNKVLIGTSVVVVVNGIDTVVVKFVLDTCENVDVMFEVLIVLAVVILSIIIVSLCLGIVITGLKVVIFLTVTFKIIFFSVVVTEVFVAVVALVKYNLVIFSIGTTVN